MQNTQKHSDNGATGDLPYPDSDWLPGLQRTIKRKLEKGEIDEVDSDTFESIVGQIVPEKEDEK